MLSLFKISSRFQNGNLKSIIKYLHLRFLEKDYVFFSHPIFHQGIKYYSFQTGIGNLLKFCLLLGWKNNKCKVKFPAILIAPFYFCIADFFVTVLETIEI